MIQELLSSLRDKFQYDDNLLKAIEITANLMIRKYGEEATNDIFDLFKNIKIIPVSCLNQSIANEYEKEAFGGTNPHVVEDGKESIYGTNSVGSVYSYNPIYNEEMEVVGEERLIIVDDKKGTTREGDFSKIFGTTLNMPYFIHEVNHAYGMQKPKYEKKGNKIEAKHGLYTCVMEVNKEGDKFHIKTEQGKNIIFEEMINQMITQDMLADFFKVSSYNEVIPILDSINYVPMEYDSIPVFIARELCIAMGEDTIMDLRRENNESVIDELNNVAVLSDIAIEYLGEAKPFDFFIDKNYELFQLIVNKYKHKIEVYAKLSAELMLDALAPVYAYADKKKGTVTLDKYKAKRENVLSRYNNQENKLS